jgi:hypothetical protein
MKTLIMDSGNTRHYAGAFLLTFVTCPLLSAGPTFATISVVSYWRLGENELGTVPGESNILPGAAAPNGFRRVPQMGNVQLNRTVNLSPTLAGSPCYWSVQSVDTAYAGSAFAPEQSFRPYTVLLPATATNILAGDVNNNGVVEPPELDVVLANLGTNRVTPTSVNQLLLNYLTGDPLLMTNVAGLGSSNISFNTASSPAVNFTVQTSSNLTDWQAARAGNFELSVHGHEQRTQREPILSLELSVATRRVHSVSSGMGGRLSHKLFILESVFSI